MSSSWNIITVALAATLLCVVFFFEINKTLLVEAEAERIEIEQKNNKLLKLASLTNKKLPVMIHKNIRLDQLIAKDREIIFKLNIESEVSKVDGKSVSEKFFPMMRDMFCSSSQIMEAIRFFDIKTTFEYFSASNAKITSNVYYVSECSP